MSYEPPILEVHINNIVVSTVGKSYYKKFVKLLNIQGKEKILDYGSGAGGPAYYIAKKLMGQGKLVCVDISERWMKSLKKKLKKFPNVVLRHGSIHTIKLEPDFFDMIVVHFVIHDIPADERSLVIDALYKKMKKGGKLYLREPLNQLPEEIVKMFEKQGFQKMSETLVHVPIFTKALDVKFIKM